MDFYEKFYRHLQPFTGFYDSFILDFFPQLLLVFFILIYIWTARKYLPKHIQSFLSKHSIISIFILSAIWRLYHYTNLDLRRSLPAPDVSLLYQALQDHAGEFLYYSTSQMPLSYLLYLPIVKIFGPELTHSFKLIQAQTFFLSSLASVCIFLTTRMITKNVAVSAITALIYSFAIVLFELWRDGHHLDHHAVIFLSYFAFAFVLYCSNLTKRNLIFLSLAGMALTLQSTTGFLVVLLSIVGLLFHPNFFTNIKQFMLRVIAIVSLPLAISLSLSAKNHSQTGQFATSSLGGVNLLLAAHYSIGGTEELRAEFENLNVPEWYRWCFDNPSPTAYPHIHKIYGLCYPQTKIENKCWPSDYQPLVNKLKEFGEDKIAAVVEEDLHNSCNKKYLFAGGTPNLSPRWPGIYGKESGRISIELTKKYPKLFFLKSLNRHSHLFASQGPSFLEYIVDNEAGTINSTFRNVSWLKKPAATLFTYLMRIGYIFSTLLVLFFFIDSAKKIAKRNFRSLQSEKTSMLIGIILPMFSLAVIFNVVACCENPRYFLRVAPLAILASGIFLNWLQIKFENKIHSLR